MVKMHQNLFGDRARPGPAQRDALQTPSARRKSLRGH